MSNGLRMDGILRTPEDIIEQRNAQKKSDDEKNSSKRRKQRRPKKTLKVVLIVLITMLFLGLVGWGIYSYIEMQNLRDPEYSQQLAEKDKNALIEKLSKHIELPDEEVVVATVTDKEKLADQPFFEKAEDGDKVLIFSESSMAVIYRESTDKIINSGPIAITSAEI